MAAHVLTEVRDGVAVVTLHDPDRRNAITLGMNDELVALLPELEARTDVTALVLTGTPPAFCAGADLDELQAARTPEDLRHIYAGFLRIAESTLPTVAAVNGAAVGAGMNMALACDLVVAAESARFDSRFHQIGIHPGGGHLWRLARITDVRTARAMVLFGQQLDGRRAADVGLAWECVPDTALLDRATALARRAGSPPAELVARTKQTIAQLGMVRTAADAVDLELEPQAWSARQPAFQELVASLQARITGGSRS